MSCPYPRRSQIAASHRMLVASVCMLWCGSFVWRQMSPCARATRERGASGESSYVVGVLVSRRTANVDACAVHARTATGRGARRRRGGPESEARACLEENTLEHNTKNVEKRARMRARAHAHRILYILLSGTSLRTQRHSAHSALRVLSRDSQERETKNTSAAHGHRG
jgi:hypothetical protein